MRRCSPERSALASNDAAGTVPAIFLNFGTPVDSHVTIAPDRALMRA
ncbi:hypothetical protein [Streptomyces sp. XD-27]|nr:hypothetical protein [Streptomyces sp. XD-27]WKX69394.1 hypothetical protein Q3Y56_05215 [Streptomyces sp. XD-27]